MGNYREALEYRNKYIQLNDSLYNQKVMGNLMMARIQFEEEQHQMEIARLADIISLKEDIITRQSLLLIVSGVLAGVFIVMAVLLTRFDRYQKRISAELDLKVLKRTRDLQLSECVLVRRLGEQKSLMDLISLRLHGSIATVWGLWSLKVSSGDAAMFKQEFEAVAFDLLQVSKIVDKNRKMDFVGQDTSTPSLANIDDLNADEQNAKV